MALQRAHFAASAAILALSGCDFGVAERQLSFDLPERFSAAPTSSSRETRTYPWWQDFQDPTLNALVSIAIAESPTALIAQARVNEARAAALGARNFPEGDGQLEARSVNGASSEVAEVDLEWTFFGGRQRAAQAALDRLEAAEFGADGAYQQLVADLVTAYVDLRFQQQSQVLTRRDLGSRRETLSSLISLADARSATRLDVLRAEALVVESQASLALISGRIVRQQNRIATLTGRPANALDVDLSFNGRQPLPRRILDAGLPADLLLSQPDIGQAQALYTAARNDLSAAKAARYPSLALSGNILTPLGSGDTLDTLTAGIVLPIFQQGTLAAREDAAEVRLEQAYAQWSLAVLTAVENVEAALAAIKGSADASALAQRLVRLNTDALDVARELVEAGGAATALELLESERDVTASRVVLANSRREFALNTVALYRALGVGVVAPARASGSQDRAGG